MSGVKRVAHRATSSTGEPDDFLLQLFPKLGCWQQPLQTTTGHRPWIQPSDASKHSHALHYINYECEASYIDLHDTFSKVNWQGEAERAKRKPLKKHKKDTKDTADFEVLEEGVTALSDANRATDSDEDFLDEYGNIKDNQNDEQQLPASQAAKELSPLKSPSAATGDKAAKKKSRNEMFVHKGHHTYQDYDMLQGIPKQQQQEPCLPDHQQQVSQPSSSMGSKLATKFLLAEPSHSALSEAEQGMYLHDMITFSIGRLPVNSATLSQSQRSCFERYKSYTQLVHHEQERFQQFAKDIFSHPLNNQKFSLSASIRKFIEERYEQHIEHVHRQLNGIYMPSNGINIRLVPLLNSYSSGDSATSKQFELRLEQTLLELGVVDKFTPPTFSAMFNPKTDKGTLRVQTDYDKLSQAVAATSDMENIINIPPSCDPNALKLAQACHPRVIMNLRALRTIFKNYGPVYDEKWHIPVTVSYIGEQLVYFLDDPLPKASLSQSEKHQWHASIAAKALLLKPWSHSTYQGRMLPRHKEGPEEDLFADGDISHLETFAQLDGAGDSSSDEGSLGNLEICENPSQGDTEAAEFGNKFSQMTEPHNMVEKEKRTSKNDKTYQSSVTSRSKSDEVIYPIRSRRKAHMLPSEKKADRHTRANHSINVLDSIIASQSNLLHKPKASTGCAEAYYPPAYKGEKLEVCALGSPADYTQPLNKNDNISYRLWNLWDKSKPEASRIGLLLKCSTHGVRQEQHYATRRPFCQSHTISAKLENQPLLGGERVTKTELADEWISTLVRPSSWLTRLRVDSKSHHVLGIEHKSLKQLSQEAIRLEYFKPAEQLGHAHTLLSSLISKVTTPGKYLLSHNEQTGLFCRLWKEVEDGTENPLHTFSTKSFYSNTDCKSDRFEGPRDWTQIDPFAVLAWHKELNRVPALFTPKGNMEDANESKVKRRRKGKRGERFPQS